MLRWLRAMAMSVQSALEELFAGFLQSRSRSVLVFQRERDKERIDDCELCNAGGQGRLKVFDLAWCGIETHVAHRSDRRVHRIGEAHCGGAFCFSNLQAVHGFPSCARARNAEGHIAGLDLRRTD